MYFLAFYFQSSRLSISLCLVLPLFCPSLQCFTPIISESGDINALTQHQLVYKQKGSAAQQCIVSKNGGIDSKPTQGTMLSYYNSFTLMYQRLIRITQQFYLGWVACYGLWEVWVYDKDFLELNPLERGICTIICSWSTKYYQQQGDIISRYLGNK